MNQRGASAARAQICKAAFSCLSLRAAGSVETLFLFTLFELILAFIAGLFIWIFTYHYNILLYINNYIPWTAILAQKVLYKKNCFFVFFLNIAHLNTVMSLTLTEVLHMKPLLENKKLKIFN